MHGARALVYWRLNGRAGGRSAWLEALLKRRLKAVAIVAVAAKLARMAWAMMVKGRAIAGPLPPLPEGGADETTAKVPARRRAGALQERSRR